MRLLKESSQEEQRSSSLPITFPWMKRPPQILKELVIVFLLFPSKNGDQSCRMFKIASYPTFVKKVPLDFNVFFKGKFAYFCLRKSEIPFF